MPTAGSALPRDSRKLSVHEALDEIQGLVRHLPPAAVNDQRVPAIRNLNYLGHPWVALLLLVRRWR